LKNARCRKKHLNVLLIDHDARRVTIVDEKFHRRFVDVVKNDFRLTTLGQLTGEHRLEIRTAGYAKDNGRSEARRKNEFTGENGAMTGDFVRADEKKNVAQFFLFTKKIQILQEELGVLVRCLDQLVVTRRTIFEHVDRRATRQFTLFSSLTCA
jgi:hypothetical protein